MGVNIKKPTKRMSPSLRREPPNTTVVVMALGTFDDVPVRVFNSTTPRSDAKQWAERLAKSASAVDDTVRLLCDRMGWNRESHGIRKLRIVCFHQGIPESILVDIDVVGDRPTQHRIVRYSDV
jgi:hypothetical protein